ncbi:MAG: hypothetical protein ABR587_05425 [Candidatus Binatia bacterium]
MQLQLDQTRYAVENSSSAPVELAGMPRHPDARIDGAITRVVCLALAAVFLARPQPAAATTPGENGRILYMANSNLWSMCPDGSGTRFLTSGFIADAEWSPDGERIAFSTPDTANGGGLWVMHWDGSDPVQITGENLPGGYRGDAIPEWSPDGRYLAFARARNYPAHPLGLYQYSKIDLITGVITDLINDDSVHVGAQSGNPGIAWDPSGAGGKIVAPLAKVDDSGDLGFYSFSPGGNSVPQLFASDPDYFFKAPDFRPDGDALIFCAGPFAGGTSSTWLSTGSGASPAPLFAGPNLGATFSPDGNKVIVERRVASGNINLHIADANGGPLADTGRKGSYSDWGTQPGDCGAGGSPSYEGKRINEVMLAAADGSSNVRFVELLNDRDDNFGAGSAPYKLVTYDSAGTRLHAQTLSTASLQNRDDTKPYLVATGSAVSQFGLTKNDAILSIPLPEQGQLCFTATDAEEKVDCVGWPCIAEPGDTNTTPIPAPPPGESSQRQGITGQLFQVAEPTPGANNFAGTGDCAGIGDSTTTSTSTTTTTTLPGGTKCAQPVTGGAAPTASDCLFILRAAVGSNTCATECLCAPKGSLPITASDALLCLRSAVGQAVTLNCPCTA